MSPDLDDAGVRLFASFAFPPNQLGLCGPSDSLAILERGTSGDDLAGLRDQASRFAGAWPYLQLIAGANRISDPLDARVVEAYWIGNRLLDRVPVSLLGASLEERFRARAGPGWTRLTEPLEVGARPHHNFHVFSVYPWVGLLRSIPVTEPLRVLDRCRIRWGTVREVTGDLAVVDSRPLEWNGHSLRLGRSRPESVMWRDHGRGFLPGLRPGDLVAMHWGWISQRLSPAQLRQLVSRSTQNLTIANRELARSGPTSLLDQARL